MQKQSDIKSTTSINPDAETLPELFGHLGDQVLKLLEAKLHLLKLEIKDDVVSYTSRGITFGISAAIAVVGFLFVNLALGFFLSTFFGFADERLNYTLGFLCIGAFYLLIGLVVMSIAKKRLTEINPLPERSINELRKDKQWLTREL